MMGAATVTAIIMDVATGTAIITDVAIAVTIALAIRPLIARRPSAMP